MNFDVPGWIATIAGWDRAELTYLSETERSGYLSVTYGRRGARRAVATVDLMAAPLGDTGRATWQLLAQIENRIERVQVPAKTRFVWR
jgi:hypothetical protein